MFPAAGLQQPLSHNPQLILSHLHNVSPPTQLPVSFLPIVANQQTSSHFLHCPEKLR